MSHCWPRSHSPVGFHIVFFKPRASSRQACLLSGSFHVFLYLPVSYITTFTIHAIMPTLDIHIQSLIEVKEAW